MTFDAKNFRPWYQPQAERLLASLNVGMLHHALLIGGAAGSGTELFASQLGRILLCDNAASNVVSTMGCGECQSCALLAAGTHPDFICLSPLEGKASISINAVRDAKNQLLQTAQIAKNKVCLISPAEALTENAANALLKLLEEPPEHCYFLMPTSAAHLLLPTIKSRCMKVALLAPSTEKLRSVLVEHFEAGNVDQAIAVHRGFPEPVVQALEENNIEAAFERQIDAFASGRESALALATQLDKQQLPSFLDALYQRIVEGLAGKCAGAAAKGSAQPFAKFGEHTLLAMIQRTTLAKHQLRYNPAAGLHIEALLTELYAIGREMG